MVPSSPFGVAITFASSPRDGALFTEGDGRRVRRGHFGRFELGLRVTT